MPTSNGLITGRDVRKLAIRELHLVDESISTAKIQDLAVTVAEEATPVELDTVGDVGASISLSTTWKLTTQIDLDLPAWATQVTVTGSYFTWIVAGANQNLELAVKRFDASTPAGYGVSASIASGDSGTTLHPFASSTIAAPSSTVSIYGWSRVNTGTSTQDLSQMFGTAVFTR